MYIITITPIKNTDYLVFMTIINQYSRKVKELLKTDNSFLLVNINISNYEFSYDTIWTGFDDKCELRTARFLRLKHLHKLEETGYGIIVYNKKSIKQWIKRGAGKAIFHEKIIKTLFPACLKPKKCISSAKHGVFFNISSPCGVKLHRRRPNKTEKNKIFLKRGKLCYICKSSKDITLHHLLPRAFGGGTEIDNLVPLCKKCHGNVHKDHAKLQKLMSLRFQRLFNNLKVDNQKHNQLVGTV